MAKVFFQVPFFCAPLYLLSKMTTIYPKVNESNKYKVKQEKKHWFNQKIKLQNSEILFYIYEELYADYNKPLFSSSSFSIIWYWVLSLLDCGCIVDIGCLLTTLLRGFANPFRSSRNIILSFIALFLQDFLFSNESALAFVVIWNNHFKKSFYNSQLSLFYLFTSSVSSIISSLNEEYWALLALNAALISSSSFLG